MCTKALLILMGAIFFCHGNVPGQEAKSRNHTAGINLLQLPATTLDLAYEIPLKPRYSLVINPGFTLDYSKSFDIIGFFLSPHYKCGNDGYIMKQRTGGFLKVGLAYNFRNTSGKQNFWFMGLFLTNALIHEKAVYENMVGPDIEAVDLRHTQFIPGLSGAVGYNFRISDKLSGDGGFHLSFPSKKYKDLYGYSNFIPGMGFMETCGNERIFPLPMLRLKYRLP
jgi:hypothetical protein